MDKKPFFLQFAGQGVKYFDELCHLHSHYPAIRPFIHETIAEIKSQAVQYNDRYKFLTQGIDIDQWIENPDTAPDLSYLMSQPISHPLLFLCQMLNYISLITMGIDNTVLIRHTHSATGYSTGILAALVVSMGRSLDELYQLTIKMTSVLFWGGIRTQESMATHGAHPKLVMGPDYLADGSTSCMASITGLSRSQIDELIASFSDLGSIYPAYQLDPRRWILSGLPEGMQLFREFCIKEQMDVQWQYLPMTIAAHCPYLSDAAYDAMPKDISRIGMEISGDQLQYPVWSTHDGTDLRMSKRNIIVEVMEQFYCKTAIWNKQITPLLNPDHIMHVLDFGPGTGVASLTEQYASRSNIQVIRCALPIGRQMFVNKILPTLL